MLATQEIMLPVYFSMWTSELADIVAEITDSSIGDDKSTSATEAMINSIAANGYQIVVNPKSPNAKSDIKVSTIQGVLVGHSHDGKTPTIAVVAHYDSFGVAPVMHQELYFLKSIYICGFRNCRMGLTLMVPVLPFC